MRGPKKEGLGRKGLVRPAKPHYRIP